MKQYLIATLVGLRGVCFQVTPQTSEAFQKAFGEELIIKNMPFLYIQDDGG